MLLWIESQHAAVIGLLGFGFSYALAGIILVATAVLAQRRIADDLKATTPSMLTPLAVITGLLIAFLAARVWTTLDRANNLVGQEASAIREVIVLTEGLPKDVAAPVRGAMTRYVQFVEKHDWPAMSAGAASLRNTPPGLREAMDALLAFAPQTAGQHVAQRLGAVAIEHVLESRRQRVLLSRAMISPIQWVVVVVLVALLLIAIAMIHIERPRTAAANLFLFSTAVAVCLVLLMINDRPFAAGGFTIQPDVLLEVGTH